jgi:hypothetical protein
MDYLDEKLVLLLKQMRNLNKQLSIEIQLLEQQIHEHDGIRDADEMLKLIEHIQQRGQKFYDIYYNVYTRHIVEDE